MSSHFIFQNVQGKIGEGATPTGKRTRGRPRTRRSEYMSDLAWSRSDVDSEELLDIAVDCEIFQVLLGMISPRPSAEEKRA